VVRHIARVEFCEHGGRSVDAVESVRNNGRFDVFTGIAGGLCGASGGRI
jgi:rhodanese-related sulfurtransferase